MANKRPKAQKTVIAAADREEIQRIAADARNGTHIPNTPMDATDDAMEIGRRIVKVLDRQFHDASADTVDRTEAYSNIRGLAVNGAGAEARLLLRGDAPFKITRNGSVTTISRSFSVPTHLLANGQGSVGAEQGEKGAGGTTGSYVARQYVQLDFQSWEILQWLRDHLASRRDGLDVSVTLLDEILKLKDVYPGHSPRDAMLKAGLDPSTLQMDLDVALASLDDDTDVGVRESNGA